MATATTEIKQQLIIRSGEVDCIVDLDANGVAVVVKVRYRSQGFSLDASDIDNLIAAIRAIPRP